MSVGNQFRIEKTPAFMHPNIIQALIILIECEFALLLTKNKTALRNRRLLDWSCNFLKIQFKFNVFPKTQIFKVN